MVRFDIGFGIVMEFFQFRKVGMQNRDSAMLIGFIGTSIGALWAPLGLLIAYLDWALLQAIILIAQTCAHFPLAVITW